MNSTTTLPSTVVVIKVKVLPKIPHGLLPPLCLTPMPPSPDPASPPQEPFKGV